MRFTLRLLAQALLFSHAILALPTAPESHDPEKPDKCPKKEKQLLKNPSFEDGLVNWSPGCANPISIERYGGAADGKNFLREVRFINDISYISQEVKDLKPKSKYKLHANIRIARHDEGKRECRFVAYWDMVGDAHLIADVGLKLGKKEHECDWTPFTVDFVPTKKTHRIVWAWKCLQNSIMKVEIDNLRLVEPAVPCPPKETATTAKPKPSTTTTTKPKPTKTTTTTTTKTTTTTTKNPPKPTTTTTTIKPPKTTITVTPCTTTSTSTSKTISKTTAKTTSTGSDSTTPRSTAPSTTTPEKTTTSTRFTTSTIFTTSTKTVTACPTKDTDCSDSDKEIQTTVVTVPITTTVCPITETPEPSEPPAVTPAPEKPTAPSSTYTTFITLTVCPSDKPDCTSAVNQPPIVAPPVDGTKKPSEPAIPEVTHTVVPVPPVVPGEPSKSVTPEVTPTVSTVPTPSDTAETPETPVVPDEPIIPDTPQQDTPVAVPAPATEAAPPATPPTTTTTSTSSTTLLPDESIIVAPPSPTTTEPTPSPAPIEDKKNDNPLNLITTTLPDPAQFTGAAAIVSANKLAAVVAVAAAAIFL
ncbi:hypothetical protein AJ80_07524 [Polytolypa hystricis UAMH7299]|uniref:CBM-cenC domain-containing protein n=1 Tax=Polytolypa hystricis (strain UAMH7299) TaxID=1447883 RepID=A0A2B7XNZ4_POLH7|nr:hypothetical protein AJ80_07524 [Polytolypa hystricis UAMH7299]